MSVAATTAGIHKYERMGASRPKHDDQRSAVAIDRDRIVHSHSFRRLQRKTQIVGIHSIDFFRTRLTHTIECAQLGRALTQRLDNEAVDDFVAGREDLADLVEAACLAHDLGHPPFGHTGEEALDHLAQDRWGMRFEGNAQSFRIVTLLEPKKYNRVDSPASRPLGLDLTRATLQAMTKYPWSEQDATGSKFGVYDNDEDAEYFAWLWNDGAPKRTLATEILEAADDIAYAVHDIEDGIWARLLPIDQIAQLEPWVIERVTAMAKARHAKLFSESIADEVHNELSKIFHTPLSSQQWAQVPFDRSRTAEGGLKSFCSQLTDDLVREVTDGGLLRWQGNSSLQRRIAVLKSVIWVWLIEPPELVTRRYGQRRIIRELVDGFLTEPRMLPYQDEWQRIASKGVNAQSRFVLDHVASMTDAHAEHIHSEMYGTVRGSGWE